MLPNRAIANWGELFQYRRASIVAGVIHALLFQRGILHSNRVSEKTLMRKSLQVKLLERMVNDMLCDASWFLQASPGVKVVWVNPGSKF